MIENYPQTVNTVSGYSAIVSNPALYHYHFDILIPKHDPFDWYEQEYEGTKGPEFAGPAAADEIQDEIIKAFQDILNL